MKCLTFSRFVLVWLLLVGGVVNGLGQTVPTITSISPSSGAQGTDLTFNVSNLRAVPGAANPVVFLYASTATGSIFYSASLILPSSPYTGSLTLPDFRNSSMSSFTGPLSLYIQDANGRTNVVNFTITASTAPTITSISPTSGTAGTVITVNVTNYNAPFGLVGGRQVRVMDGYTVLDSLESV
jgi:hypothetical protein